MSDPLLVKMPAEPCVVISDGENVVIATDRTCEPVRQFGAWSGPVVRATTAARLRAFADLIESSAPASPPHPQPPACGANEEKLK